MLSRRAFIGRLGGVSIVGLVAACSPTSPAPAAAPAPTAAPSPAAAPTSTAAPAPAAAPTTAQAPGGQSFKVGVVLPLSGPSGFIGQTALQGLKAKADQINAEQGGILGRPVQIMESDSTGDPTRARAAAQDLIQNQQVPFLVPDLFPAVVAAVLPVTTDQKVVSATATGDLTVGDATKYPYNFTYSVPFQVYPPPMATAFKQLGGTKAGILVSSDTGAVATGDILNSELPKLGVTVVDYQQYDVNAKDVTPQLQRLKSSGTDLLVLYAVGPTLGVVMQSLENLGWAVTVLGTPSTATGDLQKVVPADVGKQFNSVAYRVAARTSPDAIDARFVPFTVYLMKYGALDNLVPPLFQADILQLTKWGFDKAGSTNPEAVKAAFESVGGATLPDGYLFVLTNPRWSATTHTPINADFSQSFSLIKLSPVVDGTYQGTPLTVTAG